VALAPVAAVPAPHGTRDVTLFEAGQFPGDFSTLRHLRVIEEAGAVSVPPGTYGRFLVRRNTLVLGVAGSAQPSVYHLEELVLEHGARVRLVGPVILRVARKVEAESQSVLGEEAHPGWLVVEVASSSGEVDHQIAVGGSQVYGVVRAPAGIVLLEAGALVRGAVFCDRLFVGPNSRLLGP
ncbi:MAG: hypothetical protein ACRD68_08280, partial [Pyrinomonadaceae bacterium]